MDKDLVIQTPQASPLLLTVKQAAELLQLGINRTYGLARAQTLPSIKVGNSIRIPRVALERWIEQQGQNMRDEGTWPRVRPDYPRHNADATGSHE